MKLTRRQFLRGSLDVAVSQVLASLFPGLALGASQPSLPGFFVMLRTRGGLDVTLGLDPQVLPAGADAQDMFLEYTPSQIVDASGLRLGPSAVPLVPYAD